MTPSIRCPFRRRSITRHHPFWPPNSNQIDSGIRTIYDLSKGIALHCAKQGLDIRLGDGRAFIEGCGAQFDQIVLDLTDPFGPALAASAVVAVLFSNQILGLD